MAKTEHDGNIMSNGNMIKGGRPVAGAPTLAVWIYVLFKNLRSIKAWSGYQRRYRSHPRQAHSDTE